MPCGYQYTDNRKKGKVVYTGSMIGKLAGILAERSLKEVILDVGGVGYRIFISEETLKAIPTIVDSPLSLWTYLAVRENALDLYGFSSRDEREFFELLISVSGIGPKSALAILSLAPPDTLAKAIGAGDSSYLTKVSGIGRKSAEKIIVELRDKIGTLEVGGTGLAEEGEAIEALQALGYNLREAREALKKVGVEAVDTGDKVKAALKFLGQK